MTVQAQTNINAYREEAVKAIAEAKVAQSVADEAVKVYVAQGGNAEDVLPRPAEKPKVKPKVKPKEVSRSAKNGRFVSNETVDKDPDKTVTEKVK